MIIEFNKNNGEIEHIIDNRMELFGDLEKETALILPNNKKINSKTHKVDLKNRKIIKKTKEEKEARVKKNKKSKKEKEEKKRKKRINAAHKIANLENEILNLKNKVKIIENKIK